MPSSSGVCMMSDTGAQCIYKDGGFWSTACQWNKVESWDQPYCITWCWLLLFLTFVLCCPYFVSICC